MDRKTLAIIFVLILTMGCSSYTKKPAPIVKYNQMDVLKGAVITALIGRGYEIGSISSEGIATKMRTAGDRGEVQWDIVVKPMLDGALIDTTAIDKETGKVHKKVANWMVDLKAHVEKALRRAPDDLIKVGQNFETIRVTVSNALPTSPCTPVGTVSASAPGITAAQGIDAARKLLEIEGLIKGANFVVIETNNVQPMGFTLGYTLTGTAYQCTVAVETSAEPQTNNEI